MPNSRLPDPFPRPQLPPHSDNKNVVSQIRRYNRWLAESGRLLHQPDLSSYRDLLLETLAPASARVHLSSIRRSYKALIENPQQRAALVDRLQQEYATADFGAIKAMADELELRLMRAIDPQRSRVRTESVQDEADSRHIRLTPAKGAALMMRPDLSQLRGRRDVALIALLLATGLHEGEVVQLEVKDLYLTSGGVPAPRVKAGKGAKARMVPFGDMLWARQITELWLNGRESGPVFTRMRLGRGDMRRQETAAGPMTTRSVQRLLARYPISIDGQQRAVRPHDLRRSYARNLFKAGISTEVIRQNLGHVDVKTTQAYIGVLDGSDRAPVSVYEPTEILARMQAAMS